MPAVIEPRIYTPEVPEECLEPVRIVDVGFLRGFSSEAPREPRFQLERAPSFGNAN